MTTLIIKLEYPTDHPSAQVDLTALHVLNNDGAARFNRPYFFFGEVAGDEIRVSVPVGNYSVFGWVELLDPIIEYVVPMDNVTVANSNPQTVTVDFDTATVTPTVRTPRPATPDGVNLGWNRFSAAGDGGADYEIATLPGGAMRVAPDPAPVPVGRLEWLTRWHLESAPTVATPYTYDLAFRDSRRVPTSQSHSATAAELVRIDARYYGDGQPRAAYFGRGPVYPFQNSWGYSFFPVDTPTHRTEYIRTEPGLIWSDQYDPTLDDRPGLGEVYDRDRSYVPGSRLSVDWLRGPLAPGIVPQLVGPFVLACPGCRTDGMLSVMFAPLSDTVPDHVGYPDSSDDGSPIARLRLYRDGQLITDQQDVFSAVVAVPAAAATYRVIQDVTRLNYGLSTSATEDLTFRSAAGAGGGLPTGWSCGVSGTGTCTVLPMLRARLPLRTDLNGKLPVGRSPAVLTVGRVEGAEPSTITDATVETSVDGTTWRPAVATRLGNGKYRVALRNPPAWHDRKVIVRIAAHDAAGGSLTETVRDAYAVAAR